MKELSRDRAFEFGKLYLQSLGTWEFINDTWVMTGLRETKRFFGLLRHGCPLCQAKMSYYTILCQARDANGEPVGKPRPLPLYTQEGGFLPGMCYPLSDIHFGVCPAGHETARVRVLRGAFEGVEGFLVHQFKNGEMVLPACS